MKKYTLIFLSLLCSIITVEAQTLSDALRYAQTDIVGTARSMGVANSMGALGADFTAVSINPAGLGTYRRSEFSITPSFFNNRVDASLIGGGEGALSDAESNLALGNISIVMHNRPRGGKIKTSNFAIGINRIGNYNQSFNYSGKTIGSVTDRFLELSGGVQPDDLNGFEEGLGYATGAIYDFDEDLIYTSDFENVPEAEVSKRQSINSIGTNTELTFAYGANLDNKLMFGFSFNVPILNFEEDKIYREEDGEGIEEEIPYFNRLEYREFLRTSGFGLNVKLGAIYKPDKNISIGAAIHSPTTYNLTDNYFSDFEYSYTDDQLNVFSESSPDGTFDYNLRTPWKAIGNLGIVINKSGFISAEVEWMDYSNAEFDFSVRGNGNFYQDVETEVNQSINRQLGSALKLRVGGEYVFGKKYRARAGLSMVQSEFDNDDTFNKSYHAGLGVRENNFYIDIAYQLYDQEEGYAPYLTADAPQPLVNKAIKNSRVALSIGYMF